MSCKSAATVALLIAGAFMRLEELAQVFVMASFN
jgi:hypothetical protein